VFAPSGAGRSSRKYPAPGFLTIFKKTPFFFDIHYIHTGGLEMWPSFLNEEVVMNAVRSTYRVLALAIVIFSFVSAEIPAGYTGKPFPNGSGPRELNGRINFDDFDIGGINVAFFADDAWDGSAKRNKAGETTGPAFFTTNGNSTDRDTFYAAGVSYPNGVRYPDPKDTTAQDCYIGASHPSNFTKWTVHVSKAGKYWISAYWAAMDGTMAFTVNFYNGTKTATTGQISLVNPVQSYHGWRLFRDCASVTLDTGVQVMHFQNGSMHLNQDYLFFASDSGKFQTAIRRPAVAPENRTAFGIRQDHRGLSFTLDNPGLTRVKMFDCLGRQVATLLDRSLPAGYHSIALNRRAIGRGIYFVRLEQGAVGCTITIDNN
jgi:hypothetical protein